MTSTPTKRPASSSPPPSPSSQHKLHRLPDTANVGDRPLSDNDEPSGRHPPTGMLAFERKAVEYWRARTPAQFQMPKRVTTFSFDEERRIRFDDSSMRFYRPPPRGADLNYGYERWKRTDDRVNEHIDALVYALMHRGKGNPPDADPDAERRMAKVITFRGNITKIVTMLHEDQYGFELNGMMLHDTLYLEEHLSPKARMEKSQFRNERDRRYLYHGYSLESYCAGEKEWLGQPGERIGWCGDVNENVQWCDIVRTNLGGTRTIIGGEVDCVRRSPSDHSSDQPSASAQDRPRYERVELKATMKMRYGSRMQALDEERFVKKLFKYYAQSFLLGVPTIVVGFRTPDGRLQGLQEFRTLELPRLVRGKPHAWDPVAALNCASEALRFLRWACSSSSDGKNAAEDGSRSSPPHHEQERAGESEPDRSPEAPPRLCPPVYRITFASPFNSLTVRRLSEEEVEREVSGPEAQGVPRERCVDRVGFLPKDYVEWVEERERERREGEREVEREGGAKAGA